VKELLADFILALNMPFLLLGGGHGSVAGGAALLLLDLLAMAWACWRSMGLLRTHTRWPEVLHGLPILLVAPVIYLLTNCLVLVVFWNWPALP
jgi:hypothetical protein